MYDPKIGFRAVGYRCAANLEAMNLPIATVEALEILRQQFITPMEVDMVSLARSCIDDSVYLRGADRQAAPRVVDCSSFTAWLYAMRGIWLPRRSIQQRTCGHPVSLSNLRAGDLVFANGTKDYFITDPADGVGHVGMATGEGSVVHAANSKAGIIESSIDDFQDATTFRGARRLITRKHHVITFFSPNRSVEVSDDLRWIIMQKVGT